VRLTLSVGRAAVDRPALCGIVRSAQWKAG
jgi:hypothetical protein